MENDPFAQAEATYEQIRHLLDHVERALLASVALVLAPRLDDVALLESRVKSTKSIADNIRLYRPPAPGALVEFDEFVAESKDIVGCRVVTYYEHDIDPLIELLLAKIALLSGQQGSVVSQKLTRGDALRGSQFGYRAAHITFPLSHYFDVLSIFPAGIPAEIQVRSLLSDSWARHSHRFLYKATASPETHRGFDGLAAMLETVDARIQELVSNPSPMPECKALSEEISWTAMIDRIIERVGLPLTEADVEGIYVAYENVVESPSMMDFEQAINQAWDKYSGLDFDRYSLDDSAYRVKLALYGLDQARFGDLVPLYQRRNVNDILYIYETRQDKR